MKKKTLKGPLRDFLKFPKQILTSRERPKSASYLRLKNLQGTTIGETCEKINFFQKKYLVKKVTYCRKTQKETF